MDYEQKLHDFELKLLNVFERLGKVEDKASGAWNTIREVNGRMSKLEDTVLQLKNEQQVIKENVTIMKQQQAGINKTLKVLVGVVCFLCVICIGFFIYIWKHDAELAKSILTLGSTITKTVAL